MTERLVTLSKGTVSSGVSPTSVHQEKRKYTVTVWVLATMLITQELLSTNQAEPAPVVGKVITNVEFSRVED